MLDGKRLIGPHLPLGHGLLKAADRAREIGASAVQIFTDNPTAWRRREAPPAELEEFRRRLGEAGIGPIAVHAPYLVNLCGGNDDFWRKSVATMAHELVVGRRYGASFVVMHIGSHRGLDRATGIDRLSAGLLEVLSRSADEASDDGSPPLLVLENSAGTGDGIGASIEDLADIWDAAAAAGVNMDRIGVCLDTAHLWGAGYDLGSQGGIEQLVARTEDLLGRRNVVMLHLNDSRTTLGSRLDRHEHIAAGQIGLDGLHDVLNHPWLRTLPTFLETPGMDIGYDQVNLERALLVAAGDRPPTLPPEAFAVRGARTRTAPPSP